MPCLPTQNCPYATAGDTAKFEPRQPGRKAAPHSQRPTRILARTQFSPYRGMLSTSLLGWTRTELELGRRKAQFRKKSGALVRVCRPALKANFSITIVNKWMFYFHKIYCMIVRPPCTGNSL